MKVIWVWDNHINGAMNFQGGHPLRIALLLASVSTWKKHYPEDCRVFYLDESSRNVLEKLGVVSLWDKIHVVDFAKEAVDRKLDKTPCWGASRNLATTLVSETEEPILFVDTDTIILGKFKEDLDPTIPWAFDAYRMQDLEDNFPGKLVGNRVELDSRVLHGPFKFSTFEGCNMSFAYFPRSSEAVAWGKKVLGYTDYLRESGCFEGATYFSEGILPWQFCMLADEVLFNNWIEQTYGGQKILLYREGLPIVHVEKKWYEDVDKFWKETRKYLTLAGLPENFLDCITTIQGILRT